MSKLWGLNLTRVSAVLDMHGFDQELNKVIKWVN